MAGAAPIAAAKAMKDAPSCSRSPSVTTCVWPGGGRSNSKLKRSGSFTRWMAQYQIVLNHDCGGRAQRSTPLQLASPSIACQWSAAIATRRRQV